MNIIFIYHRSKHHAQKSGYGRLTEYLDAKTIYGTSNFPYSIAKMFASMHSQASGNYNVGSVLKQIELYHTLKKTGNQPSVVHFLNGERDIRYLKFFKHKFPNTRFCATFHKPPAIIEQTITNSNSLKELHGAIAVGANQVDFISNRLQIENVSYIPHGIDTEFFIPNPLQKKEQRLLFVGQHLRDFDTFNEAIPKLAAAFPEIKVCVIIHKAYAKNIVPHPCIKIMSGVGDELLRQHYQEASLLFLPMSNSTACNSILEAMACALPIITHNVGGNGFYLKDTPNPILRRGNTDEFVATTIDLLSDPLKLAQMGIASRKKAEEFSWKSIATDVKNFYGNLFV